MYKKCISKWNLHKQACNACKKVEVDLNTKNNCPAGKILYKAVVDSILSENDWFDHYLYHIEL